MQKRLDYLLQKLKLDYHSKKNVPEETFLSIFCTFLIKDLLQSLIRSLECIIICVRVRACMRMYYVYLYIGCSIIILILKNMYSIRSFNFFFLSLFFIKVHITLFITYLT